MEQNGRKPFVLRCALLCLLSLAADIGLICLLWVEIPPQYSYLLFPLVLALVIPLFYARKWGRWDSDDPQMKKFRQWTVWFNRTLFVVLVMTTFIDQGRFLVYRFDPDLFIYIGFLIDIGLHFYGSCILSPRLQPHDP